MASLIVRRSEWLVVEVPDERLTELLDAMPVYGPSAVHRAERRDLAYRVRRARHNFNDSGLIGRLVTEPGVTVTLDGSGDVDLELVGFGDDYW